MCLSALHCSMKVIIQTGVVGRRECERVRKAECIERDDVTDAWQEREIERRRSEPVGNTGRLEQITQRAAGAFVYEAQSIRSLHTATFAPVQIDLRVAVYHRRQILFEATRLTEQWNKLILSCCDYKSVYVKGHMCRPTIAVTKPTGQDQCDNVGPTVALVKSKVKSFPEPQRLIGRRWSPFPLALSRTPADAVRPRIRG